MTQTELTQFAKPAYVRRVDDLARRAREAAREQIDQRDFDSFAGGSDD